ncbi:MAG TPA: anthranilate phosphoribosyltransferase [Verrucomicrobiae bacterium]|nr:anthranilate phosphoribosyltransferase [Verrucomicrobiae bacterium]
MLRKFTPQLAAGLALSEEQVALAVTELVSLDVLAEIKSEFLTALAGKGETVEEIAAFVRGLRALSVAPPLDDATRAGDILDVCGTGGDRLNTFNISTTVALVAAAAEIRVAKHGNRAITSQAGSADVLEALGVKIDLTPAQAAASLRDHHFAFFFAPNYHPAFQAIAPARKMCAERGQRTIFNFLGPLLNPARPSVQLMGVPQPRLCEPVASVLQALGLRRAMVVCGTVPGAEGVRHLDELSTLGANTVAEFYQANAFANSVLDPNDFPLQPATIADLTGGDRAANAEIVRRILRGEERGPKRDAVLLNAGAAFFVAHKARSLAEGWEMAGDVIDSGKAAQKLAELAAAKF